MSSKSKSTPSTPNVLSAVGAPPAGETSASTPHPDAPSTPCNTLTPAQRRALIDKPFGIVRVYGSSSGHGGCEMPPVVDDEGRYHGDNPWRGKRKPTIADYEGHD